MQGTVIIFGDTLLSMNISEKINRFVIVVGCKVIKIVPSSSFTVTQLLSTIEIPIKLPSLLDELRLSQKSCVKLNDFVSECIVITPSLTYCNGTHCG